MTAIRVSPARALDLPPTLLSAQEAMKRPEVLEMLQRLATYKLGIFMPHMHDDGTGAFQPLPDEISQVESGLETSFRPTEEIASKPDRFLPVGWIWRAGAKVPAAACEMVWQEGPGAADGSTKHKHRKISGE